MTRSWVHGWIQESLYHWVVWSPSNLKLNNQGLWSLLNSQHFLALHKIKLAKGVINIRKNMTQDGRPNHHTVEKTHVRQNSWNWICSKHFLGWNCFELQNWEATKTPRKTSDPQTKPILFYPVILRIQGFSNAPHLGSENTFSKIPGDLTSLNG